MCISKVARKRLDRLLCMANLLSSLNIEVKADLCDCQYTGSSGLCYASERVEWKGKRPNRKKKRNSSYVACVILCKQASVRGSPAGTPAQICLCILKFVHHTLCNHLTWAIEWLKVLVGFGSFYRGQSACITRSETTDVSAAIWFLKKRYVTLESATRHARQSTVGLLIQWLIDEMPAQHTILCPVSRQVCSPWLYPRGWYMWIRVPVCFSIWPSERQC